MGSMVWQEIEKNAGLIGQGFKGIFKNRFGEEPAPYSFDDLEAFKYLAENYDLRKARELLEGYLKLDDKWLKEKGYPLSQFKKHVNAVIVHSPRKSQHSNKIRIQTLITCDHCFERFNWVGEVCDLLEHYRYCDNCKKEGRDEKGNDRA